MSGVCPRLLNTSEASNRGYRSKYTNEQAVSSSHQNHRAGQLGHVVSSKKSFDGFVLDLRTVGLCIASGGI